MDAMPLHNIKKKDISTINHLETRKFQQGEHLLKYNCTVDTHINSFILRKENKPRKEI